MSDSIPVPSITINDVASMVELIDVVARRGAFEGSELVQVGQLRNKLAEFVKAAKVPKALPPPEVPEASG